MKYMNNSVPRFHCIAYGWFKESRSVILVRNFLWSNDFYVLVYVSSEENCFIRKRVDDDRTFRILLISSMLFHDFSLDLRLSSNGFVLLSSPHSLYSFYSTPFYISSSFFFFSSTLASISWIEYQKTMFSQKDQSFVATEAIVEP